MKKIYLLTTALLTGVAFAQSPAILKGPDAASPAPARVNDVTMPSPVRVMPSTGLPEFRALGKKSFSTKVGETQNDQQTNATVYRRVHLHTGGKVSVTWTTSSDASPYVTRGSGYNHFNGTSWGAISSARIEPERCGFPNYVFNPITNEEIITSHIVKAGTGNAGGIMMSRKTGLGSGTWTSTTVLDTTPTLPGVLWLQTAVAGDYLIAIGSYTDSSSTQPNRVVKNGVRTPQVYSRYQFSTNTWLVKNECLPGYDNTRYYNGGGDNYSIDANGNNVAILMGGLGDDIALWKSNDAGATWSKTVIDSFPVPAWGGNSKLDTPNVVCSDGSLAVKLDNSGTAHCFWARGAVSDSSNVPDGQYFYFPGQNAIIYWNDAMLPTDSAKVIGGMIDENQNNALDLATNWRDAGAKYGSHSIATMPSASIDAAGNIYVIFSALTEDDISTDSRNYRDIYFTFSKDGGKTWGGIRNLTSWLGLNVEQVFGTLSGTMDGRLHMTFLQKISIGRYDATNNPGAAGTHDVMYMVLDTADLFGTITGMKEMKNEVFNVGQNFPNPFTGSTVIPVNFARNTDATLTVVDLMGKEVYRAKMNDLPAGSSQLELNVSLPAGIYVYTLEAEGFKTSRRMQVTE